MGILQDIFGSSGGKVTSSENKAERFVIDDYIKEAKDSGGKDPISQSPSD